MSYNPNLPTDSSNYPNENDAGYNNYNGDVNDIGQGIYWAEDDDLYKRTKNQLGVLSWDDFKRRYGDAATRDQYDKYTYSYEARGLSNQKTSEADNIDLYKESMLEYMQAMPGFDAYSEYIPKFLEHQWDVMNRDIPQYPGQLTVNAPEEEQSMIDFLSSRLFDGGIERAYQGIEDAYSGAYEDYQPAMRQAWEETTMKPMEERLASLGLDSSSPGLELLGNEGRKYAIDEAALGRQNMVDYARAMAGTEEAKQSASSRDIGMLQALLGGRQGREAGNIQSQYSDWSMREKLPFDAARTLGTSTLATAAGAMSSGMGQALNFGQSIYDTQNENDMSRWEFGVMQPYLDKSSEPIDVPDPGLCCFIFLEARYGNGVMDRVVRRYRDENMTARNYRGYYKLAEVLVPLMRRYRSVKTAVRILMTDPMVSYGKFHYGSGRIGKIFRPIAKFWLKLFDYLGGDHPFIRENGEVV